MKRILLLAAILSIIMSLGSAQESHDMSAIPANSMEDHHMDMGPHMKMTELRDLKPGDEQRAAQVVDAARQAATKYQDYHAAIADGYEIFLPNLPQKMYHFTKKSYAIEAAVAFHPEHPTSLLYETG